MVALVGAELGSAARTKEAGVVDIAAHKVIFIVKTKGCYRLLVIYKMIPLIEA